MLHLLHRVEIDRYFRGRLGKQATARMLGRLGRCQRCRVRYHRNLLFERVGPDGEERAADRLWTSIVEAAQPGGTPPSRRAKVGRSLSALLLVGGAAAALMLLVLRGSDPVPRGRPGGAAPAPAIYLYRSVAGRQAEALAGQLRAADGILVAYSNPTDDLKYLLVFAVDPSGKVFWYYPAYEKAGDDPPAVPIRTRAEAVELGEEIRHQLAPGPLRMWAVFLPRPWRVIDVERMVRRETAEKRRTIRDLSRLPFGEGTQSSLLLEVTP
jgi:hypothetical protein